MAKKRKAGLSSQQQQAASSGSPAELDPRESRKRIVTFADVADSEDEFLAHRDEIQLGEGPEAKRQRRWAEQEEFLEPEDEEVLGFDEEEDDDEGGDGGFGEEEEEEVAASKSRKGKKGKKGREEEEEEEEEEEDDDNDQLGWGTSKSDMYGADTIETEEQALEEEAEARRLQRKQLQAMQAADYGFDEDEWQNAPVVDDQQEHEKGTVVTEVLPPLLISPDASLTEQIKILKTRYPEFEPLSKELVLLKEKHTELLGVSKTSPAVSIKLKAAAAYLGSLVMYFSLLTSTAFATETAFAPLSATELRDHPVMASLVACRELWLNVQDLSTDILVEDEEEFTEDDVSDEAPSAPIPAATPKTQHHKSRAERHADAMHAAAEARKQERLRRAEASFADLDNLLPTTTSNKKLKPQTPTTTTKSTSQPHQDAELGEEAPLTARQLAEKTGRQKSLRFYTSQIAQKAAKRGAAGNHAGGDDDLPYRERLRDRQARLNAEAAKRGQRGAAGGADLGDNDSELDDARPSARAADEDHEYYDMIAARTSQNKANRAARADAQRLAAAQGGRVVEEEVVGADGKRGISYAIEKNKGLTPHRKKDVRNPRVKKRKKFDEKKKKLASMKPTFKGGEGRGGYKGELTGIKSNVVKSVKL